MYAMCPCCCFALFLLSLNCGNVIRCLVIAVVAVVASNDTKVVSAHTILDHAVDCLPCEHLSQIEGLVGDVVMDDVCGSKVEAEHLQRPEEPVIKHLILIVNVVLWHVSVVMRI